MLKGIDISNHQEGFTVPDNTVIDFVICKATEGTNFVDWTCDNFIQQALKKNVLFGYYHFAHDEPEKEAKFFWNNTLGYTGYGIPIIDYEYGSENCRNYLERFCKTYHDISGIYPVVYVSALSSIGNVSDLAGSWIPKKCGLWLAGYPEYYTYFPDIDIPYSIEPWEFAALWQFTDNLSLNGWSVDADYAYMSKDAWSKYANGGKTVENQKPKQESKPAAGKTCEQLADEVLAGKWGNGWNRKQALDAAYGEGTYEHVQTIVDKRLSLDGC